MSGQLTAIAIGMGATFGAILVMAWKQAGHNARVEFRLKEIRDDVVVIRIDHDLERGK